MVFNLKVRGTHTARVPAWGSSLQRRGEVRVDTLLATNTDYRIQTVITVVGGISC